MRRRVLARGATGGAAAPLGGWAGGRAAPSARRGLSAGPSLPAVRGPGRAGLAKHITASRLRRRFAPLYASTEPSSSTSTSAEPSDEGDKAAQGEPAEPSGSDGPGGPPTRWDRLRFYLAGLVLSPVRLVRLVVNLAILSFLFKLVPASGVVDMETIVVHVPYSDFMRKVEKDQVMNLQVDGNYHTYRLKNERAELRRMASAVEAQGSKTKLLSFEKIKRINYVTVRPQNMNTPYDTLMRNNVQFGAPDKRFGRILTIAGNALAIGLVLTVVSRFAGGRVAGGAGTARKPSRKQLLRQNIKFKDVAGVDEAKEELREVVEYLKDPGKFAKLGARPPTGLLLLGSPGTGKTLLAKAVAGEANVPFFSIAASEFVELYVGMGASRVRELFAKARKESPAIVFIDEIDAVAKGRDTRLRSVGNDEREQTLNQLLTELDGFDTNKDSVVICMAATNRPDVLDAALLRPGRFDRRITVDRPDINGREQIFGVHLGKVKTARDAEYYKPRLAALTPGFSGADIANVCNEAALIAARRAKSAVEMEDFEAAVDRVIGGLEKKNKVISKEERRTVAYHEAGHAVVGWFLEHSEPLLKVTIVPRGSAALGFAQYLPNENLLMTKEQIRDMMCMTLGGRAAEEVMVGKISTGAQNDLERITRMAYSQVSLYGMSEAVGLVSFPNDGETFLKPYSDETAKVIDVEARELIDGCYRRTLGMVEEKRHLVKALAEALLERETLNLEELTEILGERPFKTEEIRNIDKYQMGGEE